MNYHKSSESYNIGVYIWLLALTTMVLLIIIIGGLTRLTDSGLSMTDWRPLLGVIPPLGQDSWQTVFDMYKQTPEFKIVNRNMILEEFKFIFWWEWFHRVFARLIGIVFIIPLIYFLIKKQVSKTLIARLTIVFIFGIFQAFVGWWMVKSGLSENPYVSPYRLTFHLLNALIIFSILFWIAMDYKHSLKTSFISKPFSHEFFVFFSIVLVFITIGTGGFMAGTNSGQSFNTFPFMNGKIIPDDYFLEGLGIYNIFENTVAINFNHRWFSIFVFFYIIFICFKFIKFDNNKVPKILVIIVLIFLTLQVVLGVVTLLSNVYLPLASMHQTNSILLLSTLLITYHQFKYRKVYNEQ
ncbi:COX15/CtaA family protein [Pelagibacteraceae bacterium]|nr:COX15/CtaA family protein [Pelagibacteraceae bacterium]